MSSGLETWPGLLAPHVQEPAGESPERKQAPACNSGACISGAVGALTLLRKYPYLLLAPGGYTHWLEVRSQQP
eukprot:1158070-Pelagomonas_calceolata.AAC.2